MPRSPTELQALLDLALEREAALALEVQRLRAENRALGKVLLQYAARLDSTRRAVIDEVAQVRGAHRSPKKLPAKMGWG